MVQEIGTDRVLKAVAKFIQYRFEPDERDIHIEPELEVVWWFDCEGVMHICVVSVVSSFEEHARWRDRFERALVKISTEHIGEFENQFEQVGDTCEVVILNGDKAVIKYFDGASRTMEE